MGSWLATTSMGDSPVINVEIWTDGTVRNGTSVTAYAALCLKAIQGQSWWGLGVNVSWGRYDGSGRWVQGQDIVMKSNSETQWGDTWYWVNFTVDTGNYDAGAINTSFCVYSNTGIWGVAGSPQFGYDSGYVAPSRGNVTVEVPPPNIDAWFETININWDSFNGGTSGTSYYGIFKQEGDTWDGTYSTASGIGQVWTSSNHGTFQWNGLPQYPMYYLKNVKTGKYLDVVEGIFQNDQRIQTYDFNGSQAQRWGFESIPNLKNGYYLHPDCTYNAMIHTVNTATASGTELCLWTYTGAPTTQWLVEPTGDPDGSVYIRLVANTEQVIDANVDTGGITIWEFYAQDNQKWILEDASDAWRGKWFRFNVVAFANDENTSDQTTFVGSWRKNQRPTPALNPSATPNPVNLGQPITLAWNDSTDSDFRENDKYEIELERSRNGGNYVKVGDAFYSNTNSISNYTGYVSYAQPGDLFRFRVRAYDFFNLSSAWSVYGTFEIQKSGINYPSGEQWQGHYVYAAVNGTWTMCQVFTVQNNQWTQCIMQ